MMNAAELLEQVRASSGLTQEELARRAGTSRPTLSAYEHGRKSPTVATFARLLSGAGGELAAPPHAGLGPCPPPATGCGARPGGGGSAVAPQLVGPRARVRPAVARRPGPR